MPKPNSGTFSYPGGKTTIGPWIVDHFPRHNVYVEPFGGSASTFMFKSESPAEVYNDTNGSCVAFFQAIKKRPEELKEWIRATPYSRQLFEEWVSEFKKGNTPDDLVEHAARFWFVQTASYGGKLPKDVSFAVDKKEPISKSTYKPRKWSKKANQIDHLLKRFRHVQIEHQDYRKVMDRFDGPNTLFYCDPPYVGVGDGYYEGGKFDHGSFGEVLADVEGKWVVSYDELPEWAKPHHIVSRDREWTLDPDGGKGGTEKLVMNFDPDETPKFVGAGQESVHDYLGGD